MKLSADNAFVGAIVLNGEVQLTVYKVNAKSFYGGTHTINQYKDMLDNKQKGETFKTFCSKNNIKQYNYEDWEITEEEAAKKETAAEAVKSQVVLAQGVRKEIKDFYNDRLKNKKPLRLSYTQYRGEIIRIITANNDCLLITFDGNKYLYCVSTEETVKINPEEEIFTEQTVPWTKLLSYKAA